MPTSMITLKELVQFPAFRKFTLAAGEDGLDRPVDACEILDYQFTPEMKSKYHYDVFREGMLILTSFMYATLNENLIGDAVRKLVSLNVAGIAIKNVFHIRIPDSVTRFANSARLPLFFMDDVPENSFVTLSQELYHIVNIRTHADVQQRIVDELLNQKLAEGDALSRTFQLYPSIGHDYRVDYYQPLQPVTDHTWTQIEGIVYNAPKPFKGCCRYKGGLLLFHTLDDSCWTQIAENRDPVIKKIQELIPSCTVGISWIHHRLDGMKSAIEESIQAAKIKGSAGVMRYPEIGSYRILFGAADDYRMKEFSNDILQPIFNYDASENGRLTQTLFGLVECRCNLHELSKRLDQHENTLRQRLSRIAVLTGLDFRKADQYEQLSLAVKIHNCIIALNPDKKKTPMN